MQQAQISNPILEMCIPRITNYTPRDQIFTALCKLKIGYIKKLTELPIKTDPNFKRILIRVQLNDSETAQKIKARMDEGKTIHLVYDMPWFWQLKPLQK